MKKAALDTGKIARSAGTVSVAVMCSRVLGLVREQVFAYLFGAGFTYDAFVVAFRIPNLLRDLFGEGALSTAFVTVFSDYDANRGEEAVRRLAGNVLVAVSLLLSFLILAGVWQTENIIRLMVEAGFEGIPGKMELTRLMTIIMFPFLLLVSLSSVCMGILNTRGYFFIPSLASSFFNLGSIVVGVALSLVMPKFGHPPIVGMAFGTLAGGLLQLVGQFPALRRAGFRFLPNLDLRDPGLHRILLLMVPAIAGLAALQLNVFINNYFASSLVQGSLSWLNYAFRLFMFPVGVFGVAIAIAAHPVMARHAATGDFDRLRESYVSALTIAFCLTIPATVGLIMLAEPIVRIIFEHGRFDALSTRQTSQALVYYALGLFFYSSVKVTVPVFYNINGTRYPVAGSFLAVVANVSVILLTIGSLGHRALALSISCAMAVNFIFLFSMLSSKLKGLPLGYLFRGLIRVVGGAVVMGIWLEGLELLLPSGRFSSRLLELLWLIFQIGSGGVVYVLILYLLKLRELHFILDRLAERLPGIKRP
ncbi:MAG: murein biosynthesis integral membrane protein MurJ [Proteobacteria bacterium]|nr:murein biosynthesis integral membrane protein MurJ [Pseudomonadota bacterium]MBU1688613.1 murein biosynthesis integral membrane protein MurJ [Pseudomonadota bacterium]